MHTFVIRVNASYATGLGHINRCAILRDSLSAINLNAYIVAQDATGNLGRYGTNDIVYRENEPPLEQWPNADACIVDLYEYDDNYYRHLSRKYPRILMFDDVMFQVPEKVAAVINPNMYSESRVYQADVRVFAGPQYYLLRSEFTEISSVPNAGTNVLICMGGSDPERQTGRILTIMRRITDRPIDVVFGSLNQESTLADYSGIPGVTVYTSVSRMRSLMERAAYAIVGAGTLLYELAYMGVPAACLCLAENQRMNAEAFAEKNAALFIGRHTHISDDAIAAALARLEHETALRSTIRNNAQNLIDGRGAERLAKDLTAWILTGI